MPVDKIALAIEFGNKLNDHSLKLKDITDGDGKLKTEDSKVSIIRTELHVNDAELQEIFGVLSKTGNTEEILNLRNELQKENITPMPAPPVPPNINVGAGEKGAPVKDTVPGGASVHSAQSTPLNEEESAETLAQKLAQEQVQEEEQTQNEGFWKSWGTVVLGVLGVLAWIGALFSSEEGTKGKTIFGGIGGLLLGGALVSQWPGAGKLFGRAIEAVKNVIQGETQESQSP